MMIPREQNLLPHINIDTGQLTISGEDKITGVVMPLFSAAERDAINMAIMLATEYAKLRHYREFGDWPDEEEFGRAFIKMWEEVANEQ
jgi:hypothetical protein